MERASKRRRGASTVADAAVDADYRDMWDTVPGEVLDTVVRYISSRPHHKHWVSYFDRRLVEQALRRGGPFAEALIRAVRGLTFGMTTEEERQRNVASTGTLCMSPTLVMLRKLVPSLTHLLLDSRYTGILPAFGNGCKALRSLTLLGLEPNRNVAAVLRKVGATTGEDGLRRLELKGDVLEIDGVHALESLTKLEVLRLDVRNYGCSLSGVWKALGSSLLDVHLDDRHPLQTLGISKWKKYVNSLKRLSVTCGNILLGIDTSRNSALKEVTVVDNKLINLYNVQDLRLMDVDVHATLRRPYTNLRMLSDRLRSATFLVSSHDCIPDNFSETMSLNDVTFRGCGSAEISSALGGLLDKPKVDGETIQYEPLRHLRVQLWEVGMKSLRERIKTFNLLVSYATTLETLEFHVDASKLGEFWKVLERNPRLRSVHIVVSDSSADEINSPPVWHDVGKLACNTAVKLVETCLRRPHMQSVTLVDPRWSGWKSEMANVCRAHRLTRIDVFINGVEYRTGTI